MGISKYRSVKWEESIPTTDANHWHCKHRIFMEREPNEIDKEFEGYIELRLESYSFD